MKIITMTLLKLDKNQQKERENVNTTDLALTYILTELCPGLMLSASLFNV